MAPGLPRIPKTGLRRILGALRSPQTAKTLQCLRSGPTGRTERSGGGRRKKGLSRDSACVLTWRWNGRSSKTCLLSLFVKHSLPAASPGPRPQGGMSSLVMGQSLPNPSPRGELPVGGPQRVAGASESARAFEFGGWETGQRVRLGGRFQMQREASLGRFWVSRPCESPPVSGEPSQTRPGARVIKTAASRPTHRLAGTPKSNAKEPVF